MKITTVHEGVVPISSSIRNAWIDFSSMDCSIVAVVSDVVRDGEPVVGYGFNSNGRYSAGEILRRRVIPRLLDADPEALLDRGRAARSHAGRGTFMMNNEKPGGHGERSVAVGVRRHGAVRPGLQDRRAAAVPLAVRPLRRRAARRARCSSTPRAATTRPARTCATCRTRCAGFLDQGYHVVKMKIGGADLAEDLRRIEAVLEVLDGDGSRLAVDVNGRFDLATALRVRQGHRALRPVLVRGGRRPAGLPAQRHPLRALPRPDRDRGEPVLAAGRPQPDPLRRPAPGPRLPSRSTPR